MAWGRGGERAGGDGELFGHSGGDAAGDVPDGDGIDRGQHGDADGGGTLGIATLGAILNAQLAPTLRAVGGADVSALLSPATRGALTAEAIRQVQSALTSGPREVYLIIAILAACGVAFACFIPARRPATQPAPAGPAVAREAVGEE